MVSILIPTLNASKNLEALLNTLNNQTVHCGELIVIDSSSDDNTVPIAEAHGASVMRIDRKAFDHGGTRNAAASKASGDVLVFLTQDVMPADQHFLENLVRPLEHTDVIASYGRQLARDDAVPPERFARLFNYPDMPSIKGKSDIPRLGIKTFFLSNVCSAIKRAEFEKMGRFPENVIMDEDLVFAARAIMEGYKIAYVPDAVVFHSHNYSPVQQFRRYFDIGVILGRQNWILELAAAEGEGFNYLKKELQYLYDNKKGHWIPYALLLAAAKFSGYRLGLMEAKLPVPAKKCFSMHRFYWDRTG